MSSYTPGEAWSLTREISPRNRVRAADVLASGDQINSYSHTRELHEDVPATTWAMYLADDDYRYAYLGFDFDAKSGDAAYDASRLSYWLGELNMPHLVCRSGPSGGRHVWVRLSEPADAEDVRTLALLARDLLPSLDVTPMSNPATGCLRPPGAPHRDGGASEPLGSVTALTSHRAHGDAVQHLTNLLTDLGAALPVKAPVTLPQNVERDQAGDIRIVGTERTLTPRIAAIVQAPVTGDASFTLAQVLAACAQARWTLTQVRERLSSSPAFERVRTYRVGNHREPRTQVDAERVLRTAWNHAVTYVAANPTGELDEAVIREREQTTVAAVTAMQARANALPGLWRTRNARTHGTYSQRAVLDAICLFMLQALNTTVEADGRRIALHTGYGRTTVFLALHMLVKHGWLRKVGTAHGIHGQQYQPGEKFSTGNHVPDRSQAHAPALRAALLRTLTTRLTPHQHDAFSAPKSLGHTAAVIYNHIVTNAGTTLREIALRLRLGSRTLTHHLTRLTQSRLLYTSAGSLRTTSADLDALAAALNVNGHGADRQARYQTERTVWGWWLRELEWMKQRGRKHTRQTPAPALPHLQQPIEHTKYPRTPNGRANHRRARAITRALQTHPDPSTATPDALVAPNGHSPASRG